jgi:hypothetical protein
VDQSACNYDALAGCDDGSCIYFIDCAGICGGPNVQDACGNCYDPNQLGQSETLQFNYTGGVQTWVVPAGITSVQVTCYGAQGGSNGIGFSGGLGGEANGDLSVNPGDVLYIYAGGSGASGGWNGGGVCQGPWQGGKGGGASDIRLNGQSLTDRVIVAGGGGGNAGYSNGYGGWMGGLGGAGGGLLGTDGTQNPGNQPYPGGGAGGTQVNGGAVGYTGVGGGNYLVGTAGSLGVGGNGAGEPGNAGDCGSAGSGGGGYYGGGGGGYNNCGGGGGGGGSSYIGGVQNGNTISGTRTGNGMVVISYAGNGIPECNIGCTDPNACNFDENAEIDNGSCSYPDGCIDANACNYNANATCDDGSCLYGGCVDQSACNYDALAGCDDGSCIYFIDCAGICGGPNVQDACGNCYDPNQLGQSETLQFNYTGGVQTWVVPAGITSVQVTCYGAQGGSNGIGFSGGLGGEANGDLSVNPGDVLYIYAGGSGASGGWNGGGVCQGPWQGGKGGGASDIRLNGQSLTDRVIVAGGGGGNAGYSNGYGGWMGGLGGAGGGLLGTDGTQNPGNQPYPGGGAGGTQVNGGAVGYTGVGGGNYLVGTAGSLGVGGNGAGEPGNASDCGSAGSGGGGYYGGGGGGYNNCGGGGGGGGSSYIGGVQNGNTYAGIRSGDGYVLISYSGLQIPECLPGCTNPLAINFDPLANYDDGTCQIVGCTNPQAINYNPQANIDDGSCEVPGCTYPTAVNYNPLANDDDGSCVFSPCAELPGCTDPMALNYNPNAVTDDGSCSYPVPGCTDPMACNFNQSAQVDDGSCDFSCYGCTYIGADNYNVNATRDDGSCVYSCAQDINNDGFVNSGDLLNLLAAFGFVCP